MFNHISVSFKTFANVFNLKIYECVRQSTRSLYDVEASYLLSDTDTHLRIALPSHRSHAVKNKT